MKNILPDDIVSMVRAEGKNLNFGSIKLEIILRDGHPRWEITRSRSILEETKELEERVMNSASKTEV